MFPFATLNIMEKHIDLVFGAYRHYRGESRTEYKRDLVDAVGTKTKAQTGHIFIPNLAERAQRLTLENSGVTISLNGEIPTRGFAFSPRKDTELAVDKDGFNQSVIEEYIKNHAEELSKPNRYLGIWVDHEDIS